MGVMRGYPLRNKWGQSFQANVADSVNIDRTPRVREQILAGDFHRMPDPETGGRVSVEKTFFYTDFGRRQFFLVLPRWDRHMWQEASFELDRMLNHVPSSIVPLDTRQIRVVFGLAELREKLIAFDAEFDDALIETLKAVILCEHTFLRQYPRLNLVLDRVNAGWVEFVASYDHHPQRYRIGYPRRLVDELFAHGAELKEWMLELEGQSSVGDNGNGDSHWVNLRRSSPSTWALAELDRWARRAEAGQLTEEDINSNGFDSMLQLLPKGTALSSAAKHDLEIIRNCAGDKTRERHPAESLAEELAELYLEKELTGEWGFLKPKLVKRLWSVLASLSDRDVEGNGFVDEIRLGVPGGDNFYDPQTRDIGIDRSTLPKGRAYDLEWFEQIVLHEVGHAVHAKHSKKVDQWLRDRFGWERFTMSVADIDKWVEALGGYPSNAAARVPEQIRSLIRQSVGEPGKWTTPGRPDAPKDHPWSAEGFKPRRACELTAQRKKGRRWYHFYNQWLEWEQKRFFVNYYYQQLMIVDDRAINLVRDKALSVYALMAPPEFFAELYATVHGKQPRLERRRKNVPEDVLVFFGSLGEPEPPEGRESPAPSGGPREPEGPEPRPVLVTEPRSGDVS